MIALYSLFGVDIGVKMNLCALIVAKRRCIIDFTLSGLFFTSTTCFITGIGIYFAVDKMFGTSMMIYSGAVLCGLIISLLAVVLGYCWDYFTNADGRTIRPAQTTGAATPPVTIAAATAATVPTTVHAVQITV